MLVKSLTSANPASSTSREAVASPYLTPGPLADVFLHVRHVVRRVALVKILGRN